MKRVLVANRGEIAVRIIKTLKNMGIESVAIYHSDEKSALHTESANFSISLGSGNLTETYLNIPKILSIARSTNCDAIHPGYGFLSENAELSFACLENKLIFIGPSGESIRAMSIKSEAKEIARKANIPVLEGMSVNTLSEVDKLDHIYPLLIKAVAGGGGKGLKIVRNKQELKPAFESARREAEQYFSNDQLMLEPYIEKARHIEVQVLGDSFGNVIHLFERECSIQRNYQKVIEEAPAHNLSLELKSKLYDAAIRFTKSLNYTGAGTIEFLVKDNSFWFLEMNTRIQVEHPVTEMISGVDIVEEQIKIAQSNKIPEALNNLTPIGHSIEVRVCAEDPFNGFRPSSGIIQYVHFPQAARVDSFIQSGTVLTQHFDSLFAKIIVHEDNRTKALESIKHAVSDTVVLGVDTNLAYLNEIISHEQYKENEIHTFFLQEKADDLLKSYTKRKSKSDVQKLIAAFLFNEYIKTPEKNELLWGKLGSAHHLKNITIKVDELDFQIKLTSGKENQFVYHCCDKRFEVEVIQSEANFISYTLNNEFHELSFAKGDLLDLYAYNGIVFGVSGTGILRMGKVFLKKNKSLQSDEINQILSPLFGKVIHVNVKELDKVNKGDVLLTIESMKTENHILAPGKGIVDVIHVQNGAQIKENIELITMSSIN